MSCSSRRPPRPRRRECSPCPPTDPVAEFRAAWLPHVTDAGLDRLVELLEKASPLLIHGAFTRAVPMGCLASHIAWNHPETGHLQHEAGVMWLTPRRRAEPGHVGASSSPGTATASATSSSATALLAACRAEHEPTRRRRTSEIDRELRRTAEPGPCCRASSNPR